jgi:hypothetical protein
MLEEMGESGAIFGLDAEADVVVDGNYDEGRGGVAGKSDLEAVGECVIGDGNGESGYGGLSESAGCEQTCESCNRL